MWAFGEATVSLILADFLLAALLVAGGARRWVLALAYVVLFCAGFAAVAL